MHRQMEPDPVFQEVQRFRQVWIWMAVTLVAGLVWVAAISQLAWQRPFGDRPLPDLPLFLVWLVFGLGLPALFLCGRLVTEVNANGIGVRFVPFHRTSRRIAFEDVTHCEVRKYRPIREYGGWGIRYGSRGMAYNVSGDHGVQLELRNGKRVLIGSRRPEELGRAIQARLDRCAASYADPR